MGGQGLVPVTMNKAEEARSAAFLACTPPRNVPKT